MSKSIAIKYDARKLEVDATRSGMVSDDHRVIKARHARFLQMSAVTGNSVGVPSGCILSPFTVRGSRK
jgi:hypothetical protein